MVYRWWFGLYIVKIGGYGVANISVRVGTEHVLDGFSGMILIVDPDHDAWNREGANEKNKALYYLGLYAVCRVWSINYFPANF